jgi:hypothetical protein
MSIEFNHTILARQDAHGSPASCIGSFRDIRGHSLEGIATIILGAKLNKLVAEGLLTSAADPNHRQRAIYNLTKSPSHYHLR